MKPYSRKEIPGLTFIFSLPEPAKSMKDFVDNAPCTLWKPTQVFMSYDGINPIVSASGSPVKELTYDKGEIIVPFGELKSALVAHANQHLKFGMIFEVRLALPMGLDDPSKTFEEDLWRIGYVHVPVMQRTKEKRGLRDSYGYYLLEKHVAGTPLRLDIEESTGEQAQFIGDERARWSSRFKRW